MLEIAWKDLAREVGVSDSAPVPAGVSRAHVRLDSREVTPGDIFIARVGEAVDANRFLPDVAARGAALIITEKSSDELLRQGYLPSGDTPIWQVRNTERALGAIARAHLASLRGRAHSGAAALQAVVGITGSAGKTTTKDILAAILRSQGPTVAPVGSFNNEVGLPLTVLEATPETRFLILEMGADAPGDLTYLTGIAPLDIAVVLMVGRAHLGHYRSIDELAAAKAEILPGLRLDGVAVLNADDPRVAAMPVPANARKVTFSASGRGALRAANLSLDAASQARFDLTKGTASAPVSLQIPGEHHVSNALAAATVADVLGVPLADIARELSAFTAASPHRMERFEAAPALHFIDDAYNANPDSMRAALAVLAREEGRKVAVLGEMLELGAASAGLHREVGEAAAGAGVAVLVGVGAEAGAIEAGFSAVSSHAEVHHCVDHTEVIKLLQQVCQSGDRILLKGSNGTKLWQVANEIQERGSLA